MSTTISKLDKNFKQKEVDPANQWHWINAFSRRLCLRGLPWHKENNNSFSRFPLRAKEKVRPDVWELALMPAGGRLCFKTNSSRLIIRAVNKEINPFCHMPATGHSGFCLYEGTERIHPWAAGIPDAVSPSFERELFRDQSRDWREFTLYLPLYNQLQRLEIGIEPDAGIKQPSALVHPQPVVFYGSSVTQGGCASLPGSDFVATVGRRLNIDAINLGFSGNGIGEPEVAELISEIDASLFVLDYAPNPSSDTLRKSLPVFYDILRKKHPRTPILLITHLPIWGIRFNRESLAIYETKRDIMIHFYSQQRQAGDKEIHLVDCSTLIPIGGEAVFVDGVHPTDHGFQVMAERLTPVIERLIWGVRG